MAASDLPAQLLFDAGLVGLPGLRSFRVAVGDGGLIELESLDEPGFGLLAFDAEAVRPGIRDSLAEAGLAEAGERLLVVLSIHGEPPSVTANLAGPLAVAGDGRARQLVVGLPGYDVRTPLEVG